MANKRYLAISILIIIFSMASPTLASTTSPYTVDFDLHNMAGFNDNTISAEDIVAFIQEKYPDSPMLSEADIGSCFISAGQTNNVNPAFLVATACLEGGFGTLGWAQSHPECHNPFGYGIPSGATQPDDYNCMDGWCAMVQRVASVIAHGTNYYAQGLNTVSQVRAKYAASPNAASMADLMNELYSFSVNRKANGSNEAIVSGSPSISTKTQTPTAQHGTTVQAPSEEFNRTFGGKNDEVANSVQTTSDGGYILAGNTQNQVRDQIGSAWLAKTDAQGNELWNKTLSPPMSNSNYIYTVGGEAKSVQPTSDGGYILTGWLDNTGIGRRPWILKTDDKGNVIWMKESNALSSIQPTSDGSYIIAGTTLDRPWMSKIDDKGNEIWNKTFDTFDVVRQMYQTGRSAAHSVLPTSDGGYILAGMNYGYCEPVNGCRDTETWLIKTDDKGNEIWNKIFGGAGGSSYNDQVVSVHFASDGGYILASLQTTSFDNRLIKTDDMGNEIWNKKFSIYSINGHDLNTMSDGGYILAGRGFGAELVKIDAEGNELWNKTFGGNPYESTSEFRSVLSTSDGSYIVAGMTNSFGAGGYDAWLVKTDAEGLVKTFPQQPKSSDIQDLPGTSQNTTTHDETSEPPQKSPGFAGFLAIAALLCIFIMWRKY